MPPKKPRKQGDIVIRNARRSSLRGRFTKSGMTSRLLKDRGAEPR
jgi:hypothetical protein